MDRRPETRSFRPKPNLKFLMSVCSSAVVASPRLPLSQHEAQTMSSSSSKPSPPTITAGGSGFVVFIFATPCLPLSQQEAQTLSSLSSKLPPTITVGSCPAHQIESCWPKSQSDHPLTKHFLGSPLHRGQQYTRNRTP